MSSDDVVIINDDNQKDSDIEVVDVPKANNPERTSTQDNNTIIIDDDDVEIIDVDAQKTNKDIREYLTKICTDNRFIGEFIEKCLDLENTNGMLRVIYRTFLPLYFKMEDGYRESYDFKKVLDMAIRALEVHPHLKFTHVKFVCDIMKNRSRDGERKKVQITTISTNVTAKLPKPRKQRKRRKRRSKYSSAKKSKMRTQNVIEVQESSDGEDKNEEPALDTPETDDVVILEDCINCNDVSNTSNKENRIFEGNSTATATVHKSDINIDRVNNLNERTSILEASQPWMQSGPCLDESNNENQKKERIQQIEKQIAYYKNIIDRLEEEEVKSDSADSAYIRCERFKAHIVLLYKELCSLTGDDPVKKREVHFTATDGRPQLPLMILEKFINDSIGPDGNPCLPDFFDVQECVSRANECAKLGWDKARVWQEARALFTFCGQALQKSRKKREWRYMLGLAHAQFDDDPAERDPGLMARLEANRRIAVKKELDLLEQYVKMEEGRNDGEAISNEFNVSQDCSDDEIEENTFAASASTVTKKNSLDSENNLSHFAASASCGDSVNRFVDNQVQEMAVKQFQNRFSDTRMLEISINGNQIPEIREVTVNHTNGIREKTVASSQTNDIPRMIEVCVENNKPPEVKVINVASSDCTKKRNVEQDSITEISTCVIEFDNSISEKFLETFEDTYKDFVKNRAPGADKFNNPRAKSKSRNIPESLPLVTKDVYSVGSNKNGQWNSTNKCSENMPLLIKDVYSIATENIDERQNKTGNDNKNRDKTVDVENKSLLTNEMAVSTNQNDPCTQSKSYGKNRSNDTSVAPENMPILIKNVYSVAPELNNTSIQVSSPDLHNNYVTEQENPSGNLSSGEVNEAQNNVCDNNLLVPNKTVTVTPNKNSELPTPDVEEGNLIVKTEVSDLLKEMENFGDSFTTTVFDIEDPFLVIEISDSSDESDDDLES